MAKTTKKVASATTPTAKRSYFFTYILPVGKEADITAAKQAIEVLVKKHAGKVIQADDWGKKPLSYRIRHQAEWHREGYYVHMVLEFEPNKAISFEQDTYLQTSIIRHLLVVADPKLIESKEK